MNDDARQAEAGSIDTIKLVAAIALVVAGIAGYYVLAGQPGYVRWLSVAAGAGAGAIVYALSAGGRSFAQFVRDARVELRKVFWPNRQETLTTTLVVFGFTVVASLFFWVLDLILAWVTRALTGQGG